jgi:hypothetical protein
MFQSLATPDRRAFKGIFFYFFPLYLWKLVPLKSDSPPSFLSYCLSHPRVSFRSDRSHFGWLRLEL